MRAWTKGVPLPEVPEALMRYLAERHVLPVLEQLEQGELFTPDEVS